MIIKKVSLLPVCIFLSTVVSADPININAELTHLLKNHALITEANQELISAQQQLKSADSGWYPTLSLNGQYGHENLTRDVGADTKMTTKQAGASLRQPLWDFGKTSSTVNKAKKQVEVKQTEQTLQSQNLLLAGLQAYINLKKAYLVTEFARQSEDNIKAQTQLENTRISKGRGYTTDVLQAKAQLAGARAKRVSAEQTLSAAKNRYTAVFGVPAPQNSDMPMVSVPETLLPKTEDELIKHLMQHNPDVRRDRLNVEVAGAERDRIEATQSMPELSLVASTNYSKNESGTPGDRTSNQIALQFNWSFNLAGQASHQTKAAAADEAAQQSKADYALSSAKETAKNAWTDLILAKERAGYLQDQTQIAEQFVKLARKERELGRRSLIDVLSGETTLINAQSDYSAAQEDVVMASYNILRSMGELSLSNLQGL